jgi:hypothetical protein
MVFVPKGSISPYGGTDGRGWNIWEVGHSKKSLGHWEIEVQRVVIKRPCVDLPILFLSVLGLRYD